jgi:hypothetical protein
MKSFNAVAAALLFGGMFAGSASASSIIMLGDAPSGAMSSVISLGDPDPCADHACDPQDDVASAGSTSDSNAALVDSFGMPTNMPVIMRPSVDAPTAPAATTAAADPAAPAATPAPAQQQPVQQPEPVVQQPKAEPAPVVQQPAADGQQQQQQPSGMPVER